MGLGGVGADKGGRKSHAKKALGTRTNAKDKRAGEDEFQARLMEIDHD